MNKCDTTVNIPLKRFKELEKLEETIKENDPLLHIEGEYDYEIGDWQTRLYCDEEAVNEIKDWLKEKIKYEVKAKYKEDNPSAVKSIYNSIKKVFKQW